MEREREHMAAEMAKEQMWHEKEMAMRERELEMESMEMEHEREVMMAASSTSGQAQRCSVRSPPWSLAGSSPRPC